MTFAFVGLLVGCGTDTKELTERVARIETRVEALEKKPTVEPGEMKEQDAVHPTLLPIDDGPWQVGVFKKGLGGWSSKPKYTFSAAVIDDDNNNLPDLPPGTPNPANSPSTDRSWNEVLWSSSVLSADVLSLSQDSSTAWVITKLGDNVIPTCTANNPCKARHVSISFWPFSSMEPSPAPASACNGHCEAAASYHAAGWYRICGVPADNIIIAGCKESNVPANDPHVVFQVVPGAQDFTVTYYTKQTSLPPRPWVVVPDGVTSVPDGWKKIMAETVTLAYQAP